MSEPLLELHRVTYELDGTTLLFEVSLTIHEGEIVGLVFQQGIGKTSLLRIGSGLLRPTAGEVVFRGRRVADIPAAEAPFGFVFRDGGLLENMTVRDNVALPLRYHSGLRGEALDRRVAETLAEVGIEESADRFPYELTRDRQRLAALARDVVRRPALIFVDDFFRGADAAAYQQLEDAIVQTRDRHGTAFVLVLEAVPQGFGPTDRLCLIDHGAVLETSRTSVG